VRSIIYLLFVLTISLVACADDPKTTPEEVVKLYQAYVDQNEFDKARQLSTPAEAKRLQELEQMIAADSTASLLYTSFEQINCRAISKDTVECDCVLADQYETYSALFVVVRQGGQWVIDIPRPESVEYENEMESILDSLREELLEEN
jgi:hypothetical protein